MGGCEIFGDDEIVVSNFRFLPQIFGGGILLPGRAASGGALAPETPRAHWIGPEQGRNFEKKIEKICP